MEMMVGMSRVANEYGLDVWIWYPAMDQDYSDLNTVERALREWGEVFAKMPRLDAVFVPGGDPGANPPELLLPFLKDIGERLMSQHPTAHVLRSTCTERTLPPGYQPVVRRGCLSAGYPNSSGALPSVAACR